MPHAAICSACGLVPAPHLCPVRAERVEQKVWSSKAWQVARRAARRRDGERCVRCGETERLVVHHIEAVARGGGNELENLATLCVGCHGLAERRPRGTPWEKKFRTDQRSRSSTSYLKASSARSVAGARSLVPRRWAKRRLAPVVEGVALALCTSPRDNDGRLVLGSVSRPYRSPVSRFGLALGADLAPLTTAADTQRLMGVGESAGGQG